MLVLFIWLLDHVIYLKVRKKCPVCKAEQIHLGEEIGHFVNLHCIAEKSRDPIAN